MAVSRTVTIVTRDNNQDTEEINIGYVNPTLPGASLTAAVNAIMEVTDNTFVVAYVTDKQILSTMP